MFSFKPATTFHGMFARALAHLALLTIPVLLASAFLSSAVQAEMPENRMPENQTSRVQTLMSEHDCWTGKAPADIGEFGPGHAVVTVPNQKGKLVTRYTDADAGYAIWLDHAPGTLNGFCR